MARRAFLLAFAPTSTTIVSGAVAERFSFQAYALVAALMSGLIFPIAATGVDSFGVVIAASQLF